MLKDHMKDNGMPVLTLPLNKVIFTEFLNHLSDRNSKVFVSVEFDQITGTMFFLTTLFILFAQCKYLQSIYL